MLVRGWLLANSDDRFASVQSGGTCADAVMLYQVHVVLGETEQVPFPASMPSVAIGDDVVCCSGYLGHYRRCQIEKSKVIVPADIIACEKHVAQTESCTAGRCQAWVEKHVGCHSPLIAASLLAFDFCDPLE